MPTTTSVIEKIDRLLEDDEHFSTRSGLRFMTSIMRDALMVINQAVERVEAADEQIKSADNRIKSMEDALKTFMQMQTQEKARAEEERTKWRWAIISPTIGVLLVQIATWIFK